MISKLLRRLSFRRQRYVVVNVKTVTRDDIRARAREMRQSLGLPAHPALGGDV